MAETAPSAITIAKPRKIVFNKNAPEYFELLELIEKNGRNKYAKGRDGRTVVARRKRPYRPNKWFEFDLKWRREQAAKKDGLMETLLEDKACEAQRKALNDFYKFVSQPVYKEKDLTLRDAFRIGVQKRPWHTSTTEFFESIAPYHMIEKEHFRAILFAYFKFKPFDSFGCHKIVNRLFYAFAVAPPRNHQGSPVPERLDFRKIVCGLKALQDPAPEFARENVRFFLDVYTEQSAAKGKQVRVDDFVASLLTCSLTGHDRMVALAARATLNKRQGLLNDNRFDLNFWKDLPTPRPQDGDSGIELDFDSNLPTSMAVDELMRFVGETPLLLEELGEQQMTCLALSHRTRVIVDLCISCERRKDHILDNMRLKKAMYYWHVATLDSTITQWRAHTVRHHEIRENCKKGDNYFFKKKGGVYVQRWLGFTKRKKEYYENVRQTTILFRAWTLKHMWGRWRMWTGISRKMNEYGRMQKRQEYIHACKNLVRTWHRILGVRTKGGIIHAFHRWGIVNHEKEELRDAALHHAMALQRSHLKRWVRYYNDVIKAQKIENLRIAEQQTYLMQMKADGERLRLEQEAAMAAEAKRLQDEEDAEIDRRIEEEDRTKSARRRAEMAMDQNLILRMQQETRTAYRQAKEDERRLVFDRKWDSMEAAMATKAKMRAEEYMDSEGGTNRLKKEVLDLIEDVSCNIKGKEEREALMAKVGDPPRFGRVRWIIRYDRKSATKYYLNTETGDKEVPDDLVQMNKKARRKCERIAVDNYIDKEMIKAREKAEDLRVKAWAKELRTEAAKVIHRFWRRVQAKKELVGQQWMVDIRRAKRLKELQDPAATAIQCQWRRRRARKLLLYEMVPESIQVHTTEGRGKIPYYFNVVTGESVWEMPRLLVAMDRDKTVQKEILDRHFSRRNRRRDRVRAIMYQERKDAKAREEADDMY
jgi:hypothetical protein